MAALGRCWLLISSTTRWRCCWIEASRDADMNMQSKQTADLYFVAAESSVSAIIILGSRLWFSAVQFLLIYLLWFLLCNWFDTAEGVGSLQ